MITLSWMNLDHLQHIYSLTSHYIIHITWSINHQTTISILIETSQLRHPSQPYVSFHHFTSTSTTPHKQKHFDHHSYTDPYSLQYSHHHLNYTHSHTIKHPLSHISTTSLAPTFTPHLHPHLHSMTPHSHPLTPTLTTSSHTHLQTLTLTTTLVGWATLTQYFHS